jgi:putative nucleotidyltransferase with HDIG domain
MEKYKKYVDIIKDMFNNTKETAGGANFRFYHSYQVAHTANMLAKMLKLSEREVDIVTIAGLFHDSGKNNRISKEGYLYSSREEEEKFNLERHENISARIVERDLKDDFNADFIKVVQNIIIDDKQDNILTNVLNDADDLSEMGAMNLWKMFSYSAYNNRSIKDTIDYWNNTDYLRHLKKMKTRLKLKISKEIAQNRIKLTNKVIIALEKEIGL